MIEFQFPELLQIEFLVRVEVLFRCFCRSPYVLEITRKLNMKFFIHPHDNMRWVRQELFVLDTDRILHVVGKLEIRQVFPVPHINWILKKPLVLFVSLCFASAALEVFPPKDILCVRKYRNHGSSEVDLRECEHTWTPTHTSSVLKITQGLRKNWSNDILSRLPIAW